MADCHRLNDLSKRAIKLLMIAMAVFALGAISIPFVGSLSPTSHSIEDAVQLGIVIDLDELVPGTFIEKSSDYSRYFVLRDFDGEVYVYSIRYYDDAYLIAEHSWDRPFMSCSHFGPDSVGSKLMEGGKMRCDDPDMSDWSRRESVWDYSGKNMGEKTDDMPEAEHEIRGSMLMIKDSVWPLSDVERDDD